MINMNLASGLEPIAEPPRVSTAMPPAGIGAAMLDTLALFSSPKLTSYDGSTFFAST
jgi:hypothetical protein